ncbi:hypothetical protein PVAND_003954 [Polypedilum vanderplanki]|uniref:Uncharacterized protein n=1 Tax=Polypedilum vanderplanki TaxID=319348 RepID=A0A9J6BXK4_POLVA|nr:hypothetical protein PVAND_003954 [Polypedilum vanderplanki]
MKSITTIEFYRYHRKLILLHFEIESFEFTRFKYPFTTDKYLTILQNEELYSKINDVLREVTKHENWKNCKLQGKLRVSELFVEYRLLEKSESLINFEKVDYEFEWFMKIQIYRRPNKASNNDLKESNSVKSTDNKQNSVKIENSDSNSIISDTTSIQLSDTIDENDANIIIKLEERKEKLLEQENEDFITYRQNKRLKLETPSKDNKTKKKAEKNNKQQQQNFMSGWLSSSGEVEKSLNHTKIAKRKEASSSNGLITGDNVIAKIMNEEKRQQFQNFLEKSNENESKKELRKIELQNYQVIDCKHLSKEEIIRTVQSIKELISEKYNELNVINNSMIGDNKIPAFVITTLGILTEKQNLLVLNEIEKICKTFEINIPREDDVIHDNIFPFVLVEILKKTHNFSTDEALLRIKTQEEYNQYYNTNDTSQ